jgi:hypothetical protein
MVCARVFVRTRIDEIDLPRLKLLRMDWHRFQTKFISQSKNTNCCTFFKVGNKNIFNFKVQKKIFVLYAKLKRHGFLNVRHAKGSYGAVKIHFIVCLALCKVHAERPSLWRSIGCPRHVLIPSREKKIKAFDVALHISVKNPKKSNRINVPGPWFWIGFI